jgi:integrase
MTTTTPQRTSRRGWREDSIYFDEARHRWVGQVSHGRGTNGIRQRPKVYAKTKDEVRAKLKALHVALDAGLDAPDNRLTVGAWLDRWIASLPGTVEPSTVDSYATIVRLHLKPALGHKVLTKLSVDDVESLWAAKRAATRTVKRDGVEVVVPAFGANMLRLMRATLRRAIAKAEREQVVVRNVAALSTPPKLARPEGRSLTVEQARALLASVDGDRLEVLYVVMLSFGLRRGEALGLSWADLDPEARTLTVRHGLRRLRAPADADGNRSGPSVLDVNGPTKREAHRRTLVLPAEVLDALKGHRARQAAERLALGPAWTETGLIFTTPIGTPLDPDNFTKRFSGVAKRAGLGHWHPHELRHSAASIMLAKGIPLYVVQDVLGHSSIKVTKDVYGHLLGGEKLAAAEAMTAALMAR